MENPKLYSELPLHSRITNRGIMQNRSSREHCKITRNEMGNVKHMQRTLAIWHKQYLLSNLRNI